MGGGKYAGRWGWVSYHPYPKLDPKRHYFKVPTILFHLGLTPKAIAIYCYLLSCEDRETYECWPSYKTIGKAVGIVSTNTVRQYVRELEGKGLLWTERTSGRFADGSPRNGNLLYHIRPIWEAVEQHNEQRNRRAV